MKLHTVLIILFFSIACSCRQTNFGYAIIDPYLTNYENDSSFVRFDSFHPSMLSPRPVAISRKEELLSIRNDYNEGLSGLTIEIILNPKLKIVDAYFNRSNDVITSYDIDYKIEKIIFEINKNPFLDTLVTGRYSLLIKHIIKMDKELKNFGTKDTSYYSTFYGKFKIYNNEEIKAKLKDTINTENINK